MLGRRALEIAELEAKYAEKLKYEYLARSVDTRAIEGFWERVVIFTSATQKPCD